MAAGAARNGILPGPPAILLKTTMDETDRTLIRLLRENARLPVSTLAASLGVSRGTVQNRMDRLLAEGAIQGFTLKLRREGRSAPVRAVAMIEVRGDRAAQTLRTLRSLPEVAAVHMTNGRWDMVAELEAETLAEFDEVLRRIRLIDGVVGSETSLLLSG